ncbi:MAG: hypothetical protein K2Q26_00265 [Bdellovibrionales bacterium]|nr:hypothetical protein [Bdellovibrionales bacterium]
MLSVVLSCLISNSFAADRILPPSAERRHAREAHLQSESHKKAMTCTRAELESHMKIFDQLYKDNKFTEASAELEDFMKDSECYASLASPSVSEKKSTPELKIYLKAQNNLAHVYMKSGQVTKCMQLTKELLEQQPHNLPEIANDKEITDSIKLNLKNCDEVRLQGWSEYKEKACPHKIKGLAWENQKHHKINSVVTSYLLRDGKNCVALVKSLFKNQSKTPSQIVEIPFVVLVKRSKDLHISTVQGLNSEGESHTFRCGDFSLASYQNTKKEVAFRIHGTHSNCYGGSARGHYDAILTSTDHDVAKKDEIDAILH